MTLLLYLHSRKGLACHVLETLTTLKVTRHVIKHNEIKCCVYIYIILYCYCIKISTLLVHEHSQILLPDLTFDIYYKNRNIQMILYISTCF